MSAFKYSDSFKLAQMEIPRNLTGQSNNQEVAQKVLGKFEKIKGLIFLKSLFAVLQYM